MAVIREITFGDGTVVRITDWGDYPLFSRATFPTGSFANLEETFLFNFIKGGQMPLTNARATIADTNMPGPGQLPMGHQMLVYSLQVIPDEFAVQDYPLKIEPEWHVSDAIWKWRKIFFQAYLQLVVEQTKSFVDGRLDYFPMGGGFDMLHNSMVDDSADNSEYEAGYQIVNGVRAWSATRRLAMPIHLGSLENFYVSIDFPRGGLLDTQSSFEIKAGFGLMVRLTGPRQRPTA